MSSPAFKDWPSFKQVLGTKIQLGLWLSVSLALTTLVVFLLNFSCELLSHQKPFR